MAAAVKVAVAAAVMVMLVVVGWWAVLGTVVGKLAVVVA